MTKWSDARKETVMKMIDANTIVTLDYSLTDPDENLLDAGEKPIIYLHGGYDGIFLPIEEALQGKSVGESVTVKLQPDEAFGEYNIDLVQIEPLENLPHPLAVGMQIEGSTEEESGDHSLFFTVTDIADGKAVLDGNHPLAGMALVFTGTVLAVRPARDEEIAAGRPL
jgi:FKBP-type peptidyl-prolyl cis-trans isomerase SlyD